jgi:hypothetical protein
VAAGARSLFGIKAIAGRARAVAGAGGNAGLCRGRAGAWVAEGGVVALKLFLGGMEAFLESLKFLKKGVAPVEGFTRSMNELLGGGCSGAELFARHVKIRRVREAAGLRCDLAKRLMN